jgi:hypothetical protein
VYTHVSASSIYPSKAVLWLGFSTLPVADKKTTVWNCAKLDVVKAVASSVEVTAKLLTSPSVWIARMLLGIDEFRKPAVLEKTSTLYGASAALAGIVLE